MKIQDLTRNPVGRIITTHEIPVGQVFRGKIIGSVRSVTGIFMKTAGPLRSPRINGEVVVVQLDAYPEIPCFGNVRLSNQTVMGYEPLEVELVIKKVL